MAEFVFACSLVLLILMAGYFPASAMMKSFGLPSRFPGRSVLALNLSWVLIGYMVLVIGLIGLLSRGVVVATLVPMAVIGLWMFVRDQRAGDLGTCSSWSRAPVFWSGLVLLSVLLAMGVLEVLAPPTMYDSLTYHFHIPAEYARAGEIGYHPAFPNNTPHLMEVLAVIPFLMDSEVGAQLMFFSVSLLFVGVVWQWAVHEWGRAEALLAALLIVSTPMFTYIKASGLVETGLAALSLAGLWAVWRGVRHDDAPETERRSWLLLGGSLIGAACGVKYYGLFSALAIGVMILADGVGRMATRRVVIRASWYSLGVMLLGLPFYLKNWAMTGNPLYPAAYGLFGGINWSEAMVAVNKAAMAEKRLAGGGLTAFLSSPWDLTMDGKRFDAGRTGYGPIFLALVPIGFLALLMSVRRRTAQRFAWWRPGRSLVNWLLCYLLIFWVLWFTLALQRGRHLFPAFAVLAMLMAVGIVRVWRTPSVGRSWRGGIALALAIGLGFQTAVSVLYHREFVGVAIGRVSAADYLRDKRPFWEDFQWANAHLPADAKVLNMIGNHQYYLQRAQFYPSVTMQGLIEWTALPDVDAYMALLRSLGFTHVIMKQVGLRSLDAADLQPGVRRAARLNAELLEKYGKILYQSTRHSQISRTVDIGGVTQKFLLFALPDANTAPAG